MKRSYADDIKTLQDSIKRLQEIKEVLYAVEDVALEVERSVNEIDGRIPLRENMSQIQDETQRAQAEHALDLLEETLRTRRHADGSGRPRFPPQRTPPGGFPAQLQTRQGQGQLIISVRPGEW